MKNRLITGISFIILGALIALGPQTIFPICGAGIFGQKAMHNSDETDLLMKCFYTGRAVIGVGILILAVGLLLLLFRKKQIRFGLSLAAGLNGILTLLIPTALIGVCSDVHAPCHALTLPALSILGSTVIALSAVNAVYLYKTDQEGEIVHETKTTDDSSSVRL